MTRWAARRIGDGAEGGAGRDGDPLHRPGCFAQADEQASASEEHERRRGARSRLVHRRSRLVPPRLASRKCCSSTAAASASTSSRRPRVVPPCSRIAREGAGGAHPLVPELDRQAGPLGRSASGELPRGRGARRPPSPSGVSGSPTTTPTGWWSATSSRKRGHGETLARAADERLERRGEDLGFIGKGEADADLAPVEGDDAADRAGDADGPTAPSSRRTPCCSWSASSARAGTRAPRPAACRPGSCAAGRPG